MKKKKNKYFIRVMSILIVSILLTNIGTYFIVSKVVNENFKQEQIEKEKKEKDIAAQKEKERLKKIKEQASFEINMNEKKI